MTTLDWLIIGLIIGSYLALGGGIIVRRAARRRRRDEEARAEWRRRMIEERSATILDFEPVVSFNRKAKPLEVFKDGRMSADTRSILIDENGKIVTAKEAAPFLPEPILSEADYGTPSNATWDEPSSPLTETDSGDSSFGGAGASGGWDSGGDYGGGGDSGTGSSD